MMVNNDLVGGFNHLEKYESQWEGLFHILWKKMCETTNQYIYILYCVYGLNIVAVARNGAPFGAR